MANPAINFAGFLYDDAGDAVSGATINLYDKNTSTTSRANTTTNSSGYWTIAHTTAGEFDVQITSGSSKRRIKFDDKIHLSEVDTETLNVRGNEGQPAPMYWFADEGDDAGDRWLFNAAAGGVFTMGNDLNSQGTYVAHVTITPNATVANSTFAVAGNLTVGNALTVTGTTTLNGNLVLGDAAADTLTVGATLQGASPLTFEGGTADGYETTFAITDPTADRTITFPNLTGTVQLSGNPITGTTIDASTDFTIGNTVITDGVITDSTGLQLAANLDINGTADISGTLTLGTVAAAGSDTDKFLVLDGSGNVDYRTGTQVLSDIGGGTGGGDMTSFQLEDDDGTEVTISDAKEVKIIGSGVTTNWTDTDNGTDADPYDLTITVDAAQTGITSVYNASLKLGRDADNLVDFATTDNKIIFRVEGVNEVELVQNALSPVTSDGVALGTGSLMWSDLFLASGSVINLNNGDITLTHSSETLTVAGGTFATAALTATTGVFSTSIDVTGSAGIILENDETITNSVNGTVLINGNLKVGSGSGAGVYASNGNHDVTLQTGNSTTGSITIVDGSNGTITLSPNGTGTSVIEDPVLTVGSDADGDIYYRASNKLARLANGDDGQVLTSTGGTSAPAWEDAGGGGGTIALTADGVLAAGEAVAINGSGNAVAISGYSEMYHDLTYMSDVTNGASHFRHHMIVPIADGTNRVMRLYAFSGWSYYLVIQVGTYVSATREMTWGIPLRTTHEMDAMDAYYDSAEDVVVVAYTDGGDSQAGALLVIQPHASANSIITATSGTDIAPVRSEFDSGNLHTGEHYGIHVAEDAVNDKVIVAFPDADDAGELYLWAGTIVPDDDGTAGDRHKVTQYIANTLVTADGTATTGFQMRFAHGKGCVVYNDNGDSEYTHTKGFTIDTSGTPSFSLSSVVEVFGANKKVMMAADIATTRNTPVTNQLSYDSDNDVWLVTGNWADGDSDKIPVLASFTVGTRTTAGPGGGNTIAALDTFNIASGEAPLNVPQAGSGHFLTIDTTMESSATELTDDNVVDNMDIAASIVFDEDRNCHVMVILANGLIYEGTTHRYKHNSFLRFFNVTTASAGTGIAVVDGGNYMPSMARESVPYTAIDIGNYDFNATDGFAWLRTSYDTSNNIAFLATSYRYWRHNDDGGTDEEGQALTVGAFHGRTTAAGGGAADDATRLMVYGPSNMSQFIGFNTIARTNTQSATITVMGGLNENQSSLTVGQRYFISDDGRLRAKLPGLTEHLHRAGVTQAATKLLVTGEQHSVY